MDYKQLWKGKKSAIGEGPITVWATQQPETKIYIGSHVSTFTNIIAMSLDEAQEVAEKILEYCQQKKEDK